MARFDRANISRFSFESGGRRLLVADFSVREHISRPFEIRLTLAAEEELSPQALLGEEAVLTVAGEAGERYFHGVIIEVEQSGASGRFFLWRLKLAPALHLLSLERDCRIFQEQSTESIVREVLADSGLLSERFAFRLQHKTPAPRPYCVQYRETDLDFISRLLEEEGIFYFFEHEKDKHLLVFGDGPVNYRPIAGEGRLLFNPGAGMVAEEEAVIGFQACKGPRPGKATLRDFNFERPELDLTFDDSGREDRGRERYDYPGLYGEEALGRRRAMVRRQQAELFRERAEGRSDCPRLLPGFTFRLEGHEIEGLNREYLVTEVLHEGSQPQVLQEQSGGGGSGYANRFRAVGSEVALRPELRTRKPRIRGAQTAIVTGPAGEEIYTDGHGRVKVQFHWDRRGGRDERSSCWLRVSNGWAGGGYGGVYLPRVGQEVIVGFLEGDPDRPMVTGRVYHGLNRPPYALPAEKTKSTLKSDSSLGGGGSNELRFEDRKGAEEVYLHGEKDWTIGIENDKNQRIGHDESLSVGRNRAKRVGVDQSETIGANKTVAVGVDHIEAIGANMSLAVGLNKTETVAINTAESVGVAKALTIGGFYQVTVGGAVNETVGGAKAEEVGLVRALLVGRDVLESVGGDMTVKVAVDLKESVGDTHTLNAKQILIDADTQIELKCGSAKVALKKGGDIRLEGREITVKGSGNITLKGGKILKKTGAAAGGGAASPAPAAPEAPKKPLNSGLGNDADELIEKSPTLNEQLKKFKENNGTIKFGEKGSGSSYNPNRRTITIDGSCKEDPEAAVQSLSHELGHAHSTVPKSTASKEQFVKGYLNDEGEATLSNLKARQEILANDGPDIGVAGSQGSEYKKAYDGYLKDGDREKAREAIGKIFGEKEITSTTKQPYSKYYGDYFDSVYKSSR
jgi:type VI secretion system secreted protein VgrG